MDNHNESDGRVIGIGRIVEIDHTVNDLFEMPSGVGAIRENKTEKWKPFKAS
jgi:hypothetical protein